MGSSRSAKSCRLFRLLVENMQYAVVSRNYAAAGVAQGQYLPDMEAEFQIYDARKI